MFLSSVIGTVEDVYRVSLVRRESITPVLRGKKRIQRGSAELHEIML